MESLITGFNLLLMVLGFGLLIFVHELGHFLAAKWAGIRTEGFAIGMGPVAIAWRKGIGFRAGSTASEYERRVRAHLERSAPASGGRELRREDVYRVGDELGLGETEYSLRWLPLGGFVKMLGQEDVNPNAVSEDPRSYNRCPVGKRMIVVSAGVIMNLILAAVLFVIAFLVGVRFEAPVVGDVVVNMPAARAQALNADTLGLDEPGLQPGDRIVSIDGDPVTTFPDIVLATAMVRPDQTLRFEVERREYDRPLQFELTPEKDRASGLLGVGIVPGSSTRLLDDLDEPIIATAVQRIGLREQGVRSGMLMVEADGRPVTAYQEYARIVAASDGGPVETVWTAVDRDGEPVGERVTAAFRSAPEFVAYRWRDRSPDSGLLGFTPLVRVTMVNAGSPNEGILMPGDLIARIGSIDFPRRSQLHEVLERSPGSTLEVVVVRDGQRVPLTCRVSRQGMLGIGITSAHELPVTADPILSFERYSLEDRARIEDAPTPLAEAGLAIPLPGSRIDAVNGQAIATWGEFREALRAAVERTAGSGVTVELTVTPPTPEAGPEMLALTLDADEIAALRGLAWMPELDAYLFEPLTVVRNAGGNPMRAITMGVEETHKVVLMTYLTIDRLFRRTVSIEQLRGPVGIVHIGAQVADRGLVYLVFLLGVISVNLAVLNFLPLPIVDGGLFLYLVYEKLKGRPPSLAFQNAATIVGLCLIGTVFIVTFYNDIMRLIQ